MCACVPEIRVGAGPILYGFCVIAGSTARLQMVESLAEVRRQDIDAALVANKEYNE